MSMHNHECRKCHTVWCHDDRTIPEDDEAHTQAHSCPACGREEYYKADCGMTPAFCANGARTLRVGPKRLVAIREQMDRAYAAVGISCASGASRCYASAGELLLSLSNLYGSMRF